MRAVTTLLLCLTLALPAWAEDPAPAEAEADFAPVEANQPAPFAGVLLSEEQFLGVARQRLVVDELGARIGIRDRLIATLTEQLATARAAVPACESESWWSRNGVWVGMGLGVVIVGGLVYASVLVLDTR